MLYPVELPALDEGAMVAARLGERGEFAIISIENPGSGCTMRAQNGLDFRLNHDFFTKQ
jgi:hypothetical protein